MKRIMLAVAAIALGASASQAATYSIDGAHSSVSFSVRHVVGKVAGHFGTFSGGFDYDEKDLSKLSAQATIDPASVNTGIDKRDNHLRSADFFDVQKFPAMSFKSTKVSDVKGTTAKLTGDLTMHGVTKPVTLDVEILGTAADPMGKGKRTGITAKGKLSRLDYGVGPASGPMSGMVGNDIEIDIEVEGISK